MIRGHKLSFVIPVYRSADTILELYKRIVAAFPMDTEMELIFVEDCGQDNAWDVIHALVAVDRRVSGYRMSRNYGQHNALLCGIRESKGDVIITLDDDLQHSPEDIPILLSKLAEGFDVVYGAPQVEKHGLWRYVASHVTKIALEHAMGVENARSVSALRVFRAHLKEAFANYESAYVNIDVLLTWATTSFSTVIVAHNKRRAGVSGYTFYKLVQHTLNMVVGFSTKPLQLASILGFAIATFGFSLFCYVVFLWLFNGTVVPGFFFLVSLMAIFSGTQLIILGIFGEYLGRVYSQTIQKPSYVIREKTRVESNS